LAATVLSALSSALALATLAASSSALSAQALSLLAARDL
jgi:hypothetical protein